MKRKFTFLLMALLALAGFKSWGQRGYTYELVTSFPSTPDPADEYVLGYSDGTNYYFHETGENAGAMTLAAPSANTKVYTFAKEKMYDFLPNPSPVAKCNGKYLYIYSPTVKLTPTMEGSVDIDNDQVTDGNRNHYVYADGSIIKSYAWGNEMPAGGHPLSFYKRIGSAAPTYAVTLIQPEGGKGELKVSSDGGFTYTTGPINAEEGTDIYLDPDADPFYEFDEWTTTPEEFANEITGLEDGYYTFDMPAYDVTIEASYIARQTYTIEVVAGDGGTASVTFEGEPIGAAPVGLPLTLSATPDADHLFDYWRIYDDEEYIELADANTTFEMVAPEDSDKLVFKAFFKDRPKYTVNISQSMVNGTVTASPSECYSGTTVTLTAAPATGYQYTYGNISVVDANGQSVSVSYTNNGGTFTMPNSDVTVSATFTKLYSVSMGTVQNGSAYPAQGSGVAGSTINVFVTPNTGCEVISVIANYEGGSITASFDDVYSGQYLYYFDMPAADVTVNVVCALTYTVSYTQPTGGTISVSPTTYVPAGQEVSIEITNINDHYSFDYDNYESNISVKDASENPVTVNQEDNTHYNFEMPASNVTVAVTFDEDPKNNIAVNQPVGCTIQVSPSENVYAGETVYLSYYVQTGYQFVEWVVKDGEETITPEYDYGYYFTMPASENVTVTATVQALTAHTVSIASGITGGNISASTGNDHEAPINAYAGEYVYLTNTPETGYQFVSYTVTSQCETVEVYNNLYFYMPDCDVTVSATFATEDEITVFEGTSTNEYYPIYTYWGDTQGTTSQFIIPAEELGDLANSKIKGLRFKLSSNGETGNQKWDCSLAEVNYKELTGIVTEGLTPVYQGHALSFTNESDGTYWVVNFDSQFQYNGGNLLISFEVSTIGGCPHDYFYGTYTGYGYNTSYNNRESGSAFIPQTTITYLTTNTCKAPKDLAASEITGTGATISWTGNGAENYDIAYGVAATFDLSNSSTYILQDGLTTTSVQLTGLTAETEYKCAVKAHCDADNASNWSKTITFMPSAKQDLTVNDGTNTNCYVPIYADNAWSSTKSQFIIPAEQLQSMFDGTITDLTFYADLGGFNFGDARWNVYVKEVDYQTLNGLVSTEGMTLVYNGGMTIADNKLHIDFDTDYAYSDNNLLVYFELTQGGSSTWLYWYGVNTSNNTSYTWFDAYWGESSFGQSFLPKTTIRYSASDNPQTRYAITVNQPEVGGTISASKALAVEGCTITLTATPAEGYILNQWIVTDGDGTIAVTDNQFAVRTSDVAVTAVFETLPRYAITITPNEHGTIRVNYEETPDEDGYLEGERINLSAQGNEGWTLAENGYIITPADPSVTVEIQQEWNSYYFLMPACAVTVSATFRELEQYTVIYHINGVESQETVYEEEYFYPSQPTLPAGTEWYGWITEDLESSYSTTQPENRFYGGEIAENMDLYAVFKFTERVPVEGSSTWERVYNSAEVSDGDHVVMVSSSYGYYFLMGQRGSQTSGNFNATSSVSETNLINGNWPENVTVFTAISESGNWKFRFKDAYHDEETYLADYNGSLVPVCQWGGDDVWAVNSGYFSNVASGRYIYFHYNSKYFDFNSSSSDFVYLYKEVKPTQTNYYYMTEVLGFGGADEHITANTEATNVVIAKNAKLTVDNGVILNVEGICLSASHDAAQLVVADGGQLITDNAGAVATFEKNIVGYNTPGAIGNGWYFIANPTANTTVNLKEDDGSYDLYTFNPAAAAEWHNEQYIGGEQIPEENIAISRETGYLYANAANFTLKFEGELIPSGEDQTIDLVYYNGGESGREFPGFNLIGNPFSCTAYISGDFDMYKLVNGSDVEISKDGTVAPCEAFFVEATEVGETVTLSTTAPTEKSYAMPIVVNSDRGETLDRAILHLEGTRNSHKFMMNPDRTNISFAKNGERFASVSRGDETEIPMNFTADHKGSYTISFNTEDFEEEYLHLIDVVSGDNIDLLVTPSYTFEADADEYASRFRIVFGTTDINDNPATSSAPFVYISNGNLVINNVEGTASMQIVDMLGRIVRTETVSGSYNRPHNLKAGAYVITLDGRAQRIVIE